LRSDPAGSAGAGGSRSSPSSVGRARGTYRAKTDRFQRLEVKYLVDRTTRTALQRDVEALLPPDPHAGPDGGYLVRSLYFDTPDLRSYTEKMAGEPIRHKLRARAYGEDPVETDFVRLEVKSKYVSYIHKTAVGMDVEEYRAVEAALRRRRLPPAHLLDPDGPSREFFRLQRQYHFEPKVLLRYRRTAFEYSDLARIRVNFDDRLVATRDLDLLGPMRGARRILEHGNSIFELKADGKLPCWMHSLIGKYDLWNEALSKYCYAIRSQMRLSTLDRAGLGATGS